MRESPPTHLMCRSAATPVGASGPRGRRTGANGAVRLQPGTGGVRGWGGAGVGAFPSCAEVAAELIAAPGSCGR